MFRLARVWSDLLQEQEFLHPSTHPNGMNPAIIELGFSRPLLIELKPFGCFRVGTDRVVSLFRGFLKTVFRDFNSMDSVVGTKSKLYR